MGSRIITTGNSGEKVRSDCEITLELKNSGGINIILNSKVKALYENHITKLLHNILDFYLINHASLLVNDSGALDFVIAARLESAIRQLTDSGLEYLLPFNPENAYGSSKDRRRFSRLYLPGNTPSMMLNAGIHKPNAIILDLEDSVPFEKKYEARILVRNALREVNFYGAERMVRINPFPSGINDLSSVVQHNVHVILLPKCEIPEEIIEVNHEISVLKKDHNTSTEVFLMPIIETAKGIENAYEIAKSAENIVALAIGLEDYTADLGVQRTTEAHESFYARSRLVNACRAAGIQAIDSVFSDLSDKVGLERTVKKSKSLGFEGMGCIHPMQLQIIHDSYAPDKEEIEKALKIEEAFHEAQQKGLGVVSLGSKMIDPPVVKRAIKTIELAKDLGLIDKKGRNRDEN